MDSRTSSGTAEVTLPSDTQILITREFGAPKRLVYRAWTTPELIKRWWSGDRGDVIVADVDLRVGGTWRYVMTTTAGFEVAFHGEYREIIPERADRLDGDLRGYARCGSGLDAVADRIAMGAPLLRLLVQHTSREHRDAHINSGMEGGMQESMDHLEQVAISLS